MMFLGIRCSRRRLALCLAFTLAVVVVVVLQQGEIMRNILNQTMPDDTLSVEEEERQENVLNSTSEEIPLKMGGSLGLFSKSEESLKDSGSQEHGRRVATRNKTDVHHVFFLKVHKAASSTVQNIMFRFALSHHLLVMVPKEGYILSQATKDWESKAIHLPPEAARFDMLCSHLVFNEDIIRRRLHLDTVYIGVVRHPLDRFVSAFSYYKSRYRVPYLVSIPGKDPIATYLQNPALWENTGDYVSLTRNRMSFDFGMELSDMKNPAAVEKYVDYLQSVFHLVLVSERFDESMILMRRRLGWSLNDMIYRKVNTYIGPEKSHVFTEQERLAHRHFNVADYVLYERFAKRFEEHVQEELGQGLAEEVEEYRRILAQVATFCAEGTARVLYVNATDWNDGFEVERQECKTMSMSETGLVEIVRNEQNLRMKQHIPNLNV